MSTRPFIRNTGFTLIEMMLVVSIIALLISLVLPSLGKARSEARAVVCQSNLRQLSAAAITYSVNWRGKMFPYDNNGGLFYATFWMTLIDQYTGDMDELRMCPETVIDQAAQALAYSPGWGTAKAAWGMPWTGGWGFLGRNYGSYGWNAWMHSGRTSFVAGSGDVTDDRRHWKSIKLVKTPKITPFFSDMNWVDTWFHNKPGGPISNPPANLFNENSGAGRVCMDRHLRSVCHGYVDGSAGRTKLEDLWRLTWNSESAPMSPPWELPLQ